jgi:cytochrome c-type biogenesis protein CcmE
MAQATWEKSKGSALVAQNGGRWKFLVGGALMIGAILYLIVSGTVAGARYFITVEDLLNDPVYAGQTVRISGAVIGETIHFDERNLVMTFTIANIPEQYDDLATALYQAVNNEDAPRIAVRVEGQPKPDLLQGEAQAILTGRLDENGTFVASELLLKCPSRYQEAVPEQSQPEA